MRARKAMLLSSLALGALGAGRAAAVPCPNIMFVLDKTGSMQQDPNGGSTHPNKWELLQAAVIKTVNRFGAQVPFGLELFSSNAFDNNQCFTDTKISIEPAHDTAAQIVAIVKATQPTGGTNTGEAVKRAAIDPAMMDATRGDFIVLITDGDPNCNSGEPQYSIDQIKAAAAQKPSVHTFVVGFDGSGGVVPANLNNMARAGLEPIAGCTGAANSPCYYSASSAQTFNDAVDKIINQVVGGEFGTVMCDDSCYANGCQAGYVCVSDELNPKPHCQPDPCAGATCDPGSYCRLGQCVLACATPCAPSEKCVDGQCLADPCFNVTCVGGMICQPQTGQCVANPCVGKNCMAPTRCDVSSGTCVDDQCRIITCPIGTSCVAGGNCAAGVGDGGVPGNGRHAPGCAVGRAGDAAGLAVVALALCACFAVSRRKRGRR